VHLAAVRRGRGYRDIDIELDEVVIVGEAADPRRGGMRGSRGNCEDQSAKKQRERERERDFFVFIFVVIAISPLPYRQENETTGASGALSSIITQSGYNNQPLHVCELCRRVLGSSYQTYCGGVKVDTWASMEGAFLDSRVRGNDRGSPLLSRIRKACVMRGLSEI
jgi:hypothetical protein